MSAARRVVPLLAVAGLALMIVSGCAHAQTATPASAPSEPAALGPYATGTTVIDGGYSLNLADVRVYPANAATLSERHATPNPPHSYTPARSGYRYVDSSFALTALTATAAAGLTRGAIATATLVADGTSIVAGARMNGGSVPPTSSFAGGGRVVTNGGFPESPLPADFHDVFEFEVPNTAREAIVELRLRESSQTVSFRLW